MASYDDLLSLDKLIRTVCVCGAGTMGSGIAQVMAQAGFPTILYDLNNSVLEKAKLDIDQSLEALVKKGRLTSADKERIQGIIRYSEDIHTCKADLFIEAIIEKSEAKIALFNQLAELNDRASIFASNTSSLSVTSIAAATKYPERVIGMHFFNPAPVMKLLEVVKTEHTSSETLVGIVDVAKYLDKIVVVCKDSPGFIVNRVARPYYIESLRLIEEHIADFSTIDNLLEATGFKMGPFKLMDLIGNDINYAVSCSVYEQLDKPERLKPSPIQQQKVEKNELGKKTGKGYYDYS